MEQALDGTQMGSFEVPCGNMKILELIAFNCLLETVAVTWSKFFNRSTCRALSFKIGPTALSLQ